MARVKDRFAAPCVVLAGFLIAAVAHADEVAGCADAGTSTLTISSLASEARAGAREATHGNRSAEPSQSALAARGKPEFMPDIAALRASTDPRQNWRLGLTLADKALLSTVPSTRSRLISEAKSVALDLARIGMKDWLLAEIVERQVTSGSIDGARETTALIRHPGWKADSLVLIALAGRNGTTDPESERQRLSDRKAAICAALRIPDAEWRAATLSDLL